MEFLVEDLEDFCKSKKLHPNFSKLVNTGKQFWNVQPREVQRRASLGKSIRNKDPCPQPRPLLFPK